MPDPRRVGPRWAWIPLIGCLMPAALANPAPDLANGQDINELCAGCHGEFGQGGKGGEYPRLASQPASFLIRQLELFRERQRPNLAMIEYVDHRQMPDRDIADVSAYLSSLTLPTRLAADEAPQDALARLEQAKRVLNIPLAPGDLARGEALYNKECRACHGRDGWGDAAKGMPLLAGQYTDYLWRQVKKYRDRVRIHDPDDPEDTLLEAFSDQDLGDIFAFLSSVDDR